MTLEEARKVAESWKEGYHGSHCPDCAENFAIYFNEFFPQFIWTAINDSESIRIEVEPQNEDLHTDA